MLHERIELKNLPVGARFTPWGAAQSACRFADGIYLITTASHGGFWLNDQRAREFYERFPEWIPWGGMGPQWFEEDCDAAAVPVAFHELASDEEFSSAARAVRGMARGSYQRMQQFVDYLDASPSLLARLERIEKERKEQEAAPA